VGRRAFFSLFFFFGRLGRKSIKQNSHTLAFQSLPDIQK
jgi:hypothetical protein